MKLAREFRQFIARGNVVDLAVAVVIGAAFSKIVTQVVDGVIMPIVGALLPGGDWKTWEVTPLDLKVGAVLGAVVDFLIVAFVIFLVVHKFVKRMIPAAPEEAPTNKSCPECLETIPFAARRCRACGSVVAPPAGAAG